MKRNFTLLFVLFTFLSPVFSQISLSGLQTYTETTATAFNNTAATIDVASVAGFAVTDRILVIQMKGADIDLSNTTSFGDIVDYNGAGSYELAYICSIEGNTITLENFLLNSYDPAGIVQVIKVPIYPGVTVNGTLTANPWNGSNGGVLVFETSTLVLNADIDMSGKGFRGGQYINSNFNCNFLTVRPDFFYASADDGGQKGEGIAFSAPTYAFGKGALASGGGGGNDHNSGGAGGANVSAGGLGGDNGETGVFNCKGIHHGIGGKAQTSTNKIYLGGGGGAGHGNNNVGTSGENGGGIIIIIASSINGNGFSILSEGNDAAQTTAGDAAGGGGAGGSVFLNCSTFLTSLNVSVTGGDGGDVRDSTGPRCWGPGGGGAGGNVKLKGPQLANVSIAYLGGTPGANIHANSSCTGSNQGATSGLTGQVEENLSALPEGLVDHPDCSLLLPMVMGDFSAKPTNNNVNVEWTTLSESQSDYFTVERSKDGINFENVHIVNAKGNSIDRAFYQFLDETPIIGKSYYRLKLTDTNEEITYSRIEAVLINPEFDIINFYPNPIAASETLTLEVISKRQSAAELTIYDLFGRKVIATQLELQKGISLNEIDISNLASGNYMLQLIDENNSVSLSLFVN